MGFGDLGRTSDEAADLTQVGVIATGTQTGINASTITTITTHTSSGTQYITRVVCSSTDYAKFTLVLNSSTIETQRGGPDRNIIFEFGQALKLDNSDILDIKGEHYVTGETSNFEATIYGV